jgi:hypothetical protein
MQRFNAAVEVATKKVGERQVDDLMDQLEQYHAAIGTSPRGWLQAQISLPAESLTQACITAAAVVEAAAGAAAIACEVMTEDEFDAREGFPSKQELIGAAAAAALLGISTERLRQLAVANRVQTVPVSGRRAYVRSSVEDLAAENRPGGRPRRKV